MPKILTVVGARPQFIKAAVVSHALEKVEGLEEVLVHTGQHYDHNMSQTFFEELDIPHPTYNLGISGGSHASMTARMMIALEETALEVQPDLCLLFEDTNSTLAAALVAAKLHIPVAHVEAGTRTRSMTNPEEINRICTDHVASLLMACTQDNLANLKAEGIGDRALFTGDPMYDAFLQYSSIATCEELTSLVGGASIPTPEEFYYLTCHREENTTDSNTLLDILDAMESLDAPVIYPVHPRNKTHVLDLLEQRVFPNLLFVEPVGYLESIFLVNHAKQIVTDSGGLQREAFFAGIKCTTVLDFQVWPETMVDGRNLLARPNSASILEAMTAPQHIDPAYQPFGNGAASQAIAIALTGFLKS